MILKNLYIRFYRSFNYDYLSKTNPEAEQRPWDLLDEDEKFFPFVRISLERGITTVVGGNEAGKTQCLTAVRCLLSGEGIKNSDFCRYSSRFSVDDKMSRPEFGGEFTELDDAARDALRRAAGLDAGDVIESAWFFRLNTGDFFYLRQGTTWQKPIKATPTLLKKVVLPTYFDIDAKTPLPDSVPISYLVDAASNRKAVSRRHTLEQSERFRANQTLLKSPESIQSNFAAIFEALGPAKAQPEEGLSDQLALAAKLLLDVAGIKKAAFKELQRAVKESEGYANGLVSKMNQQLADALNFSKWWSQDKEFALYLTLRDFDLVFTIRDRTGSDYLFKERSGGMSFFLSYFVQYLSHKFIDAQEILLMDEPDAYLSTVGQQDLLRIFADFADPADPETRTPIQVLYVTHSPFLIDKNHAERLRVLQKGDDEEGTRVVRDNARNHYEPLRTAFGSSVGESTFIDNCNLMLEGQGDQILLAGISSLSRRLGRNAETLDLNGVTLVPTGGVKQIPYLVYLATGRDTDKPTIAVLLDSDGEANEVKQELQDGYKGKPLIENEHVISIADVDLPHTDWVTTVQEIEDLIPPGIASLAVKHLAHEVLKPVDAAAMCQNLKEIRPDRDQKLFEATTAAVKAATPEGQRHLSVQKVGFARAVVEVASSTKGDDVDQLLANFEALFICVNEVLEAATRKNARERTTKTLNRLYKQFVKDNPATATRKQVRTYLDEVEHQLLDNALDTETIRQGIAGVRVEYNLRKDPYTQIEKYDSLKARLQQLTYTAQRELQEPDR